MTTRRDQLSTLVDYVDTTFEDCDEPVSLVRKKSDLTGGSTMWQARLVLSTLNPESERATLLRNAIRGGDVRLVNELLEVIYERATLAAGAEPLTGVAYKSTPLNTVLPPSPDIRKLEVG